MSFYCCQLFWSFRGSSVWRSYFQHCPYAQLLYITQQKLWDEAKQRVAQENTILQSKIKDAEMRVEDDFQYKAMREQKEAVLAAESAKLQSVVLRRKQQQEALRT